MILRYKNMGVVIAVGTLRKNDPVEYREVGDNATPLASFGVNVKKERNADGEWENEWLDCKAWREMAEQAAKLESGATVFVIGKLGEETWEGRDGTQRSKEVCTVEFISIPHTSSIVKILPSKGNVVPPRTPVDVAFQELEDEDGDLPF